MVSLSIFVSAIYLIVLLFSDGMCLTENIPCNEPSLEDLQGQFEQLNYFQNLKGLFFPEGWTDETIESKFTDLLSQSSKYKESGVCPSKHLKDSELLMLRTSCPWFLSENTDDNRYPRTIYTAETHCRDGCIGTTGQICEAISRRINVLVHQDSDCVNGIKQYEISYYDINVAYVCAQRPEIEQYWYY